MYLFPRTSVWDHNTGKIDNLHIFMVASYKFWQFRGMWNVIQSSLVELFISIIIFAAVFIFCFMVNWEVVHYCHTEDCVTSKPKELQGILISPSFAAVPGGYSYIAIIILTANGAVIIWELLQCIECICIQRDIHVICRSFLRPGYPTHFHYMGYKMRRVIGMSKKLFRAVIRVLSLGYKSFVGRGNYNSDVFVARARRGYQELDYSPPTRKSVNFRKGVDIYEPSDGHLAIGDDVDYLERNAKGTDSYHMGRSQELRKRTDNNNDSYMSSDDNEEEIDLIMPGDGRKTRFWFHEDSAQSEGTHNDKLPHICDISWSDFLNRLCKYIQENRDAVRSSPETFDELRAIQILMLYDNFFVALHQPRVLYGDTFGKAQEELMEEERRMRGTRRDTEIPKDDVAYYRPMSDKEVQSPPEGTLHPAPVYVQPILSLSALKYCDETVIRYLIMSMFNECSVVGRDMVEQEYALRRLTFWCAFGSVVLYFFIVPVFIIRLLVEIVNDLRANTADFFSVREWTTEATWTFRMFNEVPHMCEARLRRGSIIATRILRCAYVYTPILKAGQRFASTIILGVVCITLFNPNMLTLGVAAGLNLFTWLSIALPLYAMCNQVTMDREYTHHGDLDELIDELRYEEPCWGTSASLLCGAITTSFFMTRAIINLKSILRILCMPFVLIYLYRNQYELRVLSRFIRDNLCLLEGVGEVALSSAVQKTFAPAKFQYSNSENDDKDMYRQQVQKIEQLFEGLLRSTYQARRQQEYKERQNLKECASKNLRKSAHCEEYTEKEHRPKDVPFDMSAVSALVTHENIKSLKSFISFVTIYEKWSLREMEHDTVGLAAPVKAIHCILYDINWQECPENPSTLRIDKHTSYEGDHMKPTGFSQINFTHTRPSDSSFNQSSIMQLARHRSRLDMNAHEREMDAMRTFDRSMKTAVMTPRQ
eukprot:Tbor_TRINITY_DN5063_c0_g1::TRINITY_DN5063_c0_g1_i1::g.14197::m.14197/K17907/ATG9; autophagy-related protein 9